MAHGGTVINVGGDNDSGFASSGQPRYVGQSDRFAPGPYTQTTTDLGTFKVGGAHGNNSSFVYHPTGGSFTSGATYGGPSHGPPVRMLPEDRYDTPNPITAYPPHSSQNGSSVIMVGSDASSTPFYSHRTEALAPASFNPTPFNHATTFAKSESSTFSLGNPGNGFQMVSLQMPISTPTAASEGSVNHGSGGDYAGRSLSVPQRQLPLFSPEPRRDALQFPVYESAQSFPSSHNASGMAQGPTSVEFSPLPDGSKHGGSYKFESEPQVVIINQEGNIQQHGSRLTPKTQ